MLIEADLYYPITIGSSSSNPTIIESTLQWLVDKGLNKALSVEAAHLTNQQNEVEADKLNQTLMNFWNLESIPEAKSSAPKSKNVKNIFF